MYKDLFFTIIASTFACIGLTTGDPTQLIGAVLVSPLINPVNKMFHTGDMIHNIIEFAILAAVCVVIGMIYHHIVLSGNKLKITPQIDLLSKYDDYDKDYLYDVAYGFVAGICMYVINNKSYVSTNMSIQANAGIAIGITLLPAFVNGGILFNANDQTIKNSAKASIVLGVVYLVSIITGYAISNQVSNLIDPI